LHHQKKKAAAMASGKRQDRDSIDIIPPPKKGRKEKEPPKEASYIQFPLACLHSDYPLEKIPADYARRILQRCLAWHIVRTNIEAAYFDDLLDDASQVKKLAAEVPVTFGRQCALFPVEMFRSAVEDWPHRKFACLAAVYASIGRYEYRIVTREKILAGSVGFSNEEERKAFGSTFEPLSISKVKTEIDNLVGSNLIARERYNGRTNAYSRPKRDIKQRIANRKKAEKQERYDRLVEGLFSDEPSKDESSKDESVSKVQSLPSPVVSESPEEQRRKQEAYLQRKADESLAQEKPKPIYRPVRDHSQAKQPEPHKPPKPEPTPQEIEDRLREIERLCGEEANRR
jgi:hypothetical protein